MMEKEKPPIAERLSWRFLLSRLAGFQMPEILPIFIAKSPIPSSRPFGGLPPLSPQGFRFSVTIAHKLSNSNQPKALSQ